MQSTDAESEPHGDPGEAASHGRSSAIAVKRARGFDTVLALLVVLVVAINLPYLASRVVPIHDTFYNFANFHIFYSELFFHGDLAHWYPYGTYGLQSDYEQIISLSPATYLVGLVGALARVSDALLLFKLAAIGDQLFLVLGVYLLARRLFATRATHLVLGIGAAASSVWYAQQWWDFRIYYLLPLVLYFFASFLATRRPAQLWLAGLAGIAWALGCLPYILPLWVLVLAVIGLVASAGRYRQTIGLLATPSRANLLAFGSFAAAAAVYVYFVLHALDQTVLHAPDRDPITGRVGLENFLSYGGNADFVTVANALWFGWPLHLPWGSGVDNSFYVGMLPALGFVVAIARERSRMFLALVAAVIFLVWLSFGGLFTRLAYFLPGLAYYRHVALTYGITKTLILIASGYGLERIWARGSLRITNPVLLTIVAILVVESLVTVVSLTRGDRTAWSALSWDHLFLMRLAIYGAALVTSQLLSTSSKGALAVALALDLALFQLAVYQTRVPKLRVRDAAMLEATQVRDLHYQTDRRDRLIDPNVAATNSPANQRSQLAVDLATRPAQQAPGIGVYWYLYQFANFDPCESAYRTDFLPIGVNRLFSLKQRAGIDLAATLGCRAPKLQLFSGARVADSLAQAQELVVTAARAGTATPVIQLAQGSSLPPEASRGGAPMGSVDVTRFTLGELRASVHVDTGPGAWLVYDDAYNPGWRASVNGVETPVHEANLAFKAVWVPSGSSEVRFWFRNGPNYALGYAVAAFGASAALALLAALAWALFRPAPMKLLAP